MGDVDKFINELFNILNELINKENCLTVRSAELSNELLETLKIIENCISCKNKINGDYYYTFHDEMENFSAVLEGKRQIRRLDDVLFKMDNKLNQKILCEDCKRKKIEELTDKYGNEEIARFLYKCKLNSYSYDGYIQWIPFNEFRDIKYLAKGGFSEVHKATWIGYYYGDKIDVVLKRIYDSNDKIIDIMRELKANVEIKYNINQCYGVTKDPKENDYLLVFYHAGNGDLHDNLSKNFKEITWWDKIDSLYGIAWGLKEIHEKNYIHHDLHSGNIFSYTVWNSRIGDLGLCQQLKGKDDTSEIFGVVPYMAPEALSGEPYTKKSDIYSFGMIMWEHTTGEKPFYNRPHDHYLMLNILEGKRPEITKDTPEFYVDLMKKCWDPNQENRPNAEEICELLRKYHCLLSEERKVVELAETKRQEIIKSEKYLINKKNRKNHPESFYTSRPLSKLIQQANSLKLHQINKMIH